MKINIDNIPKDLLDKDQWVCWKKKAKDNGKFSKIPINPLTGKNASTNDISTWSTFNDAVNAHHTLEFDGIGFVFTENDPFVGIDLDDCINKSGQLEPWADEIVNRFNSFTERSPSGVGIHIYVKGSLPAGGKKKGQVEIYDRGRFFTVTGDCITDCNEAVSNCEQTVREFYDEYFTTKSQEPSSRIASQSSPNLGEIISKAIAAPNGEKFKRLWKGDIAGYQSQSEADLAFCQLVLFWAKQDIALVDEIFRKSGLFRPKWDNVTHSDGSTYGQQTIQKALSGADNSSLTPIASTNQETYNLSDLGNAERLVNLHGDDIRYCHSWREWLIWDGTRWAHDRTNQIQTKAKHTVRSIYQEASQANDSGERAAISKHAQKSEGGARITALINLAQSDPAISVSPEELDQDHWRLTCLNTTINLRTGEPSQPNRSHLITQLAPVAYEPFAQCPIWEAFLDRIMNGNKDLISFLQRAMGYALSGDTSEQCLFILYGSGANGKSTFLQAISAMLGDYAMQTPTETLLVRRKGAIPNDVARLKGARLVTASEAEADHKLAEGLIKQMTGQDTLSARFLHQEWFDFKPTHKIFLATNHKPVIHGTDLAIWRRIKLVPFEVTIPEHERDKQLLSKLEAELPGIFSWAIQGCLDWLENGLGEPVEVRAATDDYKYEMDVIARFLSDCCIIDVGACVSSKELYAAYEYWCSEVGEEPLKQRTFGMKLKEKGFKNIREKGIRSWKGLALQPLPQLDTLTHNDTTNHVSSNQSSHIEENCILESLVSHASTTPPSPLCLQGGEGVH